MNRLQATAALVMALAVAGGIVWYAVRAEEGGSVIAKLVKTDAEWRQQLTHEQYHVTRKKGTEQAFTGAYWNCHTDGVYHCVCCGQPLFDSRAKYESGTGWPSFFQPIAPDAIGEHEDRGWLSVRTEVVCSNCEAHLGHVFEDGPQPTGLRYCMNSAALKLVERKPESAGAK
jgi:peptide-methionine (R)-S-oxide reductase